MKHKEISNMTFGEEKKIMRTELELALMMFSDFKIIQGNMPRKVDKMNVQGEF